MSPLSPSTPPAALRAYVTVLVSTLLLSLTGILIKFLLDDFQLESFTLAFWRVLLVALALGLVLAFIRPALLRVPSSHLPILALLGLVGVGLHQVVWITSVQLNGVALATVLVYIQPAIVALIAWRTFGEALDRAKIFALALSLSGIILVSRAYEIGNTNLNWFGILVGLGTGVTWATYALLTRHNVQYYSSWTSLLYAFGFGALALLPLQFFVPDVFALGTSVTGWGLLIFLALGPTLGGFGLYSVGLAHLPATVVTILGTLEPVISIGLAYLLFGETLNALQLVGAGLILTSVWLLRPRMVKRET